MNDQDLLQLLKLNLEKRNSVGDELLEKLIQVAKSAIRQEGITLPDDDYTELQANAIVMYASYYYEYRRPSGDGYRTDSLFPQGMPYMLRYALNNLLFAEKMGGQT